MLEDERDGTRIAFDDASLGVADDRSAPASWSVRDLEVRGGPAGDYRAARAQGNGADPFNRLPDGSLGLTATGVAVDVGAPFEGDRSVRTLGPFEFGRGRDGGAPTVGRLSIEAGEDRWLVDAFDGDPATFTFTATVDGATVAVTLPWSARYRIDAPTPDGVDVGF